MTERQMKQKESPAEDFIGLAGTEKWEQGRKFPNRTKRALDIIETIIDGFSIVGMGRTALRKFREYAAREHLEEIERLRRVNHKLVSVNATLAEELNKANAHIERLRRSRPI